MTEKQDRYVEYIENFDVSADNMVKLNDYLDQHKLRYEIWRVLAREWTRYGLTGYLFLCCASPTSFESILNELDGEPDTPNTDVHSPSYLDDLKSDKRLAKRVLPPPERMVTRGVSGAIRHRSVDEILSAAEVKYSLPAH